MHTTVESNEVLDLIFKITSYEPMNLTTPPYFILILLVLPSSLQKKSTFTITKALWSVLQAHQVSRWLNSEAKVYDI